MPPSTAHLTLRSFRADDAGRLHAYLGDPEVVRFEPYGPHTVEQAAAEARRRATDPRFVAVEGGPDRMLIGHVFRAPVGPESARTWTVGYVFHPASGRQGFATEATRAVIDDCFRSQGAHRVTARCDPRNDRSWRLLERVGMRREGHEVRCASFRTGAAGRPVWHDAYLYAVLAEEWSGRRGPSPVPAWSGR
jgi:[ribosomal protein S5]-alanine N-acetyltransferase